MRTPTMLLVLLVMILFSTIQNCFGTEKLTDNPNQENPQINNILSKYDKHRIMSQDVKAAIDEGDPKKAERLIEKYELADNGTWSSDGYAFYAHMALADFYYNVGELDQALQHYKLAHPGGGCGNCMASGTIWRDDHIARVYERKYNFLTALTVYLTTLPNTQYGGGTNLVYNGLIRAGGVCLLPINFLVIILLAIRIQRYRELVKKLTSQK